MARIRTKPVTSPTMKASTTPISNENHIENRNREPQFIAAAAPPETRKRRNCRGAPLTRLRRLGRDDQELLAEDGPCDRQAQVGLHERERHLAIAGHGVWQEARNA